MNTVKEIEKKIIYFACIEAVVASIVLVVLYKENSFNYILSLLFGFGIGVLNFLELSRTLTRAVSLSPDRAQSFAIRKYILRYLIYAIVIFVSIKSPYLHILGTIIGILLIKISIFFTQLFNNKKYFLNIIKRREGDDE